MKTNSDTSMKLNTKRYRRLALLWMGAVLSGYSTISAAAVTDSEVRTTCTQCHASSAPPLMRVAALVLNNGFNIETASIDLTTSERIAPKTLAGWVSTVSRMQDLGAVIAAGSTVSDYANYLAEKQGGAYQPTAAGSLTSIDVSSTSVTINVGETATFAATGRFYDGSVQGLSAGVFSATSAMDLDLESHVATALDNKVLIVAGATINPVTAAAQLYDPLTGMFSPTGALKTRRYGHMVTPLGNGQVLVAGGITSVPQSFYLASAELYDPLVGTFSTTGAMSVPRHFAAAARLGSEPYSKVLVTGGSTTGGGGLSTAELFNPADGRFSPTDPMATPRSHHSATFLPSNGKVLIAGGTSPDGVTRTAELYNPDGTFSPADSMATARTHHTATLLANGKVLITGGQDSLGNGIASAELYDPDANAFIPAASMGVARKWHTATELKDGKVLIAGAAIREQSASAEIYTPDAGAGSFAPTGAMGIGRWIHTATLLNNGQVLVTGGILNARSASASAEIYTPKTNWSSSNLSVATVDPNTGVATALSPGTTSITATSGTVSGSMSLRVNSPPIADPGPAKLVNEGALVTLSGVSSRDTDGSIVSYAWTQISGLAVTLAGANTATATFATPQVTARTVLTFRLTVTDNDGASAYADITVTINDTPTADPGPSQNVNEGAVATLSGINSRDSDGTIVAYEWKQIVYSGDPVVNLSGANTATATFTAPLVNAASVMLEFQLKVTDNDGATATALTWVYVKDLRPDLIVTAVSRGSVSSVARGKTFIFTATTKNDQGTAATTVATDTGLYLVHTTTKVVTPLLPSSATIAAGLAVGSNIVTNTTVTVPSTLAAGTYALRAVADYTLLQAELREDNNTFTGSTGIAGSTIKVTKN